MPIILSRVQKKEVQTPRPGVSKLRLMGQMCWLPIFGSFMPWLFYAIKSELSHCDRGCIACKAQNTCYLVFYRTLPNLV